MSNKKLTRIYQLDAEKLETLEDVKKILGVMKIRIDTDNPLFETLDCYFTTEVVPVGYCTLLEKLGDAEIAKMTYQEMEEKIRELGISTEIDD